MKLIELGTDKEKVASRFGMLHALAHQGILYDNEADNRRLKKVQERLDELRENPPGSLVLDEEWVELLKGRLFGAGIKWLAKANADALDILDVLKAAVEWKPEAEKKPMLELSEDDAA